MMSLGALYACTAAAHVHCRRTEVLWLRTMQGSDFPACIRSRAGLSVSGGVCNSSACVGFSRVQVSADQSAFCVKPAVAKRMPALATMEPRPNVRSSTSSSAAVFKEARVVDDQLQVTLLPARVRLVHH